MKLDKIYLIGFSGCGKTTIGKALAEKLNYEFADLDQLIEKNEGISISDFFKEKGEHQFREVEQAVLSKTISYPKAVISCGGGTPCFHDNMDFMLNNGTTIYLEVSEDKLVNRLSNATNERPLLNDHENDLRERIALLMEERKKDYERAHLIIENSGNEEATIEKILIALL